MEIDKFRGYLNICAKAGYIIWGGETLENYSKKLYLVLYDKNVQKNSIKIIEKLKTRNIPIYEIENLGELLNKPKSKVIGLKNKNLSDLLIKLIKE